jgi:hypothetical protein
MNFAIITHFRLMLMVRRFSIRPTGDEIPGPGSCPQNPSRYLERVCKVWTAAAAAAAAAAPRLVGIAPACQPQQSLSAMAQVASVKNFR